MRAGRSRCTSRAPTTPCGPGSGVRVTGVVGQAYGAPRVAPTGCACSAGRRRRCGTCGGRPRPAMSGASSACAARWSTSAASATAGWPSWTSAGARVPVSGLAGSGIAPGHGREGRQRRSRASCGGRTPPRPTAGSPWSRGREPTSTSPRRPGPGPRAAPRRHGARRYRRRACRPGRRRGPDADLVTLDAHVGARVRVGRLIVALLPDGARLDDGTATARLVLAGTAGDLIALLNPATRSMPPDDRAPRGRAESWSSTGPRTSSWSASSALDRQSATPSAQSRGHGAPDPAFHPWRRAWRGTTVLDTGVGGPRHAGTRDGDVGAGHGGPAPHRGRRLLQAASRPESRP